MRFNSWERNEAVESHKRRLTLEEALGMLPTEETAVIEEVQEYLVGYEDDESDHEAV